MCGILGIAVAGHPGGYPDGGVAPGVNEADVVRMRDTMQHRGPDGAGLERVTLLSPGHANARGMVTLAHRRLAVLDPTPAGHQPMRYDRADGSSVWLTYNGELYNDAELRAELLPLMQREGAGFHTRCDTETLLMAIAFWGRDAVPKLRGMFAFGAVDTRSCELLLSRDPLGIKPLYAWSGRLDARGAAAARPEHDTLVFASEIPAILACPGVPCQPDWVTVSAYLTTIRTTLGSRTMFAGIETLEPGEARVYRLRDRGFDATAWRTPIVARAAAQTEGEQQAGLRDLVSATVRGHMRSDVPMCSLLSGGLDSSVIGYEAVHAMSGSSQNSGVRLQTYCSGSPGEAAIDGVPQSEDFRFAREVADALGTEHHEAPVDLAMFAQRWTEMVDRVGVPMSTPNEVAINQVARVLRAQGHVVALSGEGADELFGGYAGPMLGAMAHVQSSSDGDGVFQLMSNAWAPLDTKPAILSAGVMAHCDGDRILIEHYQRAFAGCEAEALEIPGESSADRRMQAHLRFQRRVNLAGLLARLDTATMLASVEGRTPFADAVVAGFAEGLPLSSKFRPTSSGRVTSDEPSAGMDPDTKRVLRAAYAGRLPASVVGRPKASFPLPFQRWLGDRTGLLTRGPAAEVFQPEAVAFVSADPGASWRFAWPMLNVAMWLNRWWGG